MGRTILSLTDVFYRLASPRVLDLCRALRAQAAAELAEVERLAAAYLGGDGDEELEPVSRQELARRLEEGDGLVVVDVRPSEEYAAGLPVARA